MDERGGASGQTVDGGATLRQLDNLQWKLTEAEREKMNLQRQLDSITQSSEIGTDSVIAVLQQQLTEAREALKKCREDLRRNDLERSMNNSLLTSSRSQVVFVWYY